MTDNLITTWLAVLAQRGESIAEGLRRLNATLSTRYTHSRVREWERGDRTPGAAAVNFLVAEVLPSLAADAGVDPTTAARWVEQLALVVRTP